MPMSLMPLNPPVTAWGSGMPDRNPIARLAAVLRARHVPDPEQIALLAADHLAAELATRDGHLNSAQWLTAAADLYRKRIHDA